METGTDAIGTWVYCPALFWKRGYAEEMFPDTWKTEKVVGVVVAYTPSSRGGGAGGEHYYIDFYDHSAFFYDSDESEVEAGRWNRERRTGLWWNDAEQADPREGVL